MLGSLPIARVKDTGRLSRFPGRKERLRSSIGFSYKQRWPLIAGMLALAWLIVYAPPSQSAGSSTPAWAQPHDYYDPGNSLLLSHVDGHHLEQGISKMKAGHYAPAKHDFEFMLRSFPNHPHALMQMGELALAQDNPALAEPYFTRAIELYPETASTYLVHGIFQHKQNKYSQAVRLYEKALSLDPNMAEAHYNMGLALIKMKQYARARDHAEKAYAAGYPLPGLRNQLENLGREVADRAKPTSQEN